MFAYSRRARVGLTLLVDLQVCGIDAEDERLHHPWCCVHIGANGTGEMYESTLRDASGYGVCVGDR